MAEEVQELTVEYVISLLRSSYELVEASYDDSLDDQLDKVQEAIQAQDIAVLDDCIDEYWKMEAEDYSIEYIMDELKSDILKEWEFEDEDELDSWLEDHEDEIRQAIYERDNSDPIKDMMRHTDEPVCFYDTGVELGETWNYDKQELANAMQLIKSALAIEGDKYDEEIFSLLANASYGGRLVVYFRDSIKNLL